MKTILKRVYEQPSVEVINVEVEQRVFNDSLTGGDIYGPTDGPEYNEDLFWL